MGKITIKNVCDSWVSIFVPEANFSREIPAGREIPIPDDTYNALTFDQGFMNLVNMHYIKILGVPEEEAGAGHADPGNRGHSQPGALKAL